MNITTKRLLFYWSRSFILASLLYAILWLLMPSHYVFGSPYRMHQYHKAFPFIFIAIPCFFFGIFATFFIKNFRNQTIKKQFAVIFLLIIVTILISSPFGGMLWHFFDMLAGYFPPNWTLKIIKLGTEWGLKMGWLIVALSIPYNIICSIGCYFLVKKGSELFNSKKQHNI